MTIVKDSRKKKSILLCIAIVLTFAGIYALNYFFPLYTDDWKYAFVYGRDSDRVAGFLDVLESQYYHYFHWGGRSVAHTIAQSFIYIGEQWAGLLNSLAYVTLVTLIYLIADYRRKVNPFLYAGISILVWFFVPDLMVCIAWLTGSANYLWGCMLVVSVTVPPYCMYYLKYKEPDKKKDSIGRCILFIFCGILAGWTNENLVAGLLTFLFIYILLLKYERKAIPKWVISGFIGVVIGAVFMLAAPGNFIRNKIELETIHGITPDHFSYSYYFYRLVSVIKAYLVYGIWPTIIYLFSLLLFWKKGEMDNKRNVLRLSLLFFFMAMISMLVMAGAPIFPERVWFGIIVLIIIATALLYTNLNFEYKLIKVSNYVVWIPFIIFFLVSYTLSLKDTIRLSETFEFRETYILEEKKKGIEEFILYDRFEPRQTFIFTQKVYDIPPSGE